MLQQYQGQGQTYQAAAPASAPQPRPRPQLPAYARQQQQLQQAYHQQRVPVVPPPRPPVTLHPQALAQAEAQAELQAQKEAQLRSQAIHASRLRASASDNPSYQVSNYREPKLGTFEQELLQLVNANQAQEFKLVPVERPSAQIKEASYASPQYSQQLVAYQEPYQKPVEEHRAPEQLPEQYHIETSRPRYQHQDEEVVQLQYHQAVVPAQPTKAPEYQYEDPARLKAYHFDAESIARAQGRAEAQALAYQRVAQDSHQKHQANALEQIRIAHEHHRQQAALEQIREGSQVSEAGKSHIEEQIAPKDPEAAYRAKLKAQATAAAAEDRRAQEAAEYKAHADAILKLQAQQAAHLKAQEDAHRYALNFEKNQLRAQAHAQAIANAQAQALYKAHQQARAKANIEVQAAAKAQAEARKNDPDNTSVIQYLLPNSVPLPSPNSYLGNEQHQKYQASGSTYVARAAPKNPEPTPAAEEPIYVQATPINQPRQPHKHKIPTASQSSIYVSQSGLLKKAPVKSVTIEDIIDNEEANPPQFIRIPSPKGRTLTQEDLNALINAGYTVTPVPETARSTPAPYGIESSTSGYYVKKQRTTVSRPEYIAYEEVIPRPKRPYRKPSHILKQENDGHPSEKITYLVPVEPAYGTRKPLLKNE